MNRLAQLGQERFPGIELSWLGQGSWKKLLDHLQVSKLQIVFETPAGDALDPSQHFWVWTSRAVQVTFLSWVLSLC